MIPKFQAPRPSRSDPIEIETTDLGTTGWNQHSLVGPGILGVMGLMDLGGKVDTDGD